MTVAMLCGACGSTQTEVAASTVGAEATTDARDAVVDVAVYTGSMATGTVQVDGIDVDYIAITPEGFEVGDTAPVLLALPPGGQGLDLVQRVAAATYEAEAVRRGWVVVSPAAPDGELFFNGSEQLAPSLIDWINAWVTPEGGALHLSGISNGGISAFRFATQHPDAFRSLVVFPGFPRGDQDKAALDQLTSMPVRLFVGRKRHGMDPCDGRRGRRHQLTRRRF